MSSHRATRATQAACLSLLALVSVASAQDLASGGVYVPWAAITAAVAVVGIVGTAIGLIRRGDLERIQERFDTQREQRAELVGWLQRVEQKIDEAIKDKSS